MFDEAVVERFMRYVSPDPNTGCWLWTGGYDDKGYGMFSLDGRKIRAHRMAWQIENGPMRPDLLARHKCDFRACCNPAHAEPGTHADNARDMVERGRCMPVEKHARRERNGSARLDSEKVARIRVLAAAGTAGRAIARMFGVAPSTIRRILSGECWA